MSVGECLPWKYSLVTMYKCWVGICCEKKGRKERRKEGRKRNREKEKRKVHGPRKTKSTMAILLIKHSPVKVKL